MNKKRGMSELQLVLSQNTSVNKSAGRAGIRSNHKSKAALPQESFTTFSDYEVESALVAVKTGHDPVAAMNLIKHFYECIHNNKPFHLPLLLAYLDHAFGKIVDRKGGRKKRITADSAFGLKRDIGERDRGDTTERDIVMAAYAALLRKTGLSWEIAIGKSAELFFIDNEGESAAKEAWKKYGDTFSLLEEETLVKMLPSRAEIPHRRGATSVK